MWLPRTLAGAGVALVVMAATVAGGATATADTVDTGVTVSHLDNGNPAYDYTPTVIQQGSVQRIWWCGQAPNPSDPSQNTDAILYATYDTSTGPQSNPVAVLGETTGGWDSVYTCNPGVVGGVFTNPLGDGVTYSLAMYYVGTAQGDGLLNSIGVAFSNDGVNWKKYPNPVIAPANPSSGSYGAAQPTPYNDDGQSGIQVMYQDTTLGHYYRETSTDGVHFGNPQQVSDNGWKVSNGTFAYDDQTNSWYVAMEMDGRPASTTGGVTERRRIPTPCTRSRQPVSPAVAPGHH